MTPRRLLVALLAIPVAVAAQGPVRADGHVVHFTEKDTVGVPGVRVVLHRVGRQLQGPIDSTRSGPGGSFAFRWTIDTSAVYLLSANYAGIEYFSSPLQARPGAPDTGLVLVVSDTSSTAKVGVSSRHIVISRPAKDGTRSTLEIVVLSNAGTVTRVAGDSSHPTWTAQLPRGAIGFAAGNGDVSAEAMAARNDSVVLFAPIAPGEKQVVYTYRLPDSPGRVSYPMADSVPVLNLLLEERQLTASGGGLLRADSQQIEGRTFQQWAGDMPAGSAVTIAFGGTSTRWLLPVLVGLLGVMLLGISLKAARRPPASAAATGPATTLDRLAELDARYAAGVSKFPADEWARYQAERARLKEELGRELAGKEPPG